MSNAKTNGDLSLSDIKRMHRSAKRANAKLKRKVDTMRKLREETFKLIDENKALHEDRQSLASFMWTPEKPYGY
jgi:nitrate/TMAO reductase-like tetraheme cytochrome c subunit